MRRSSREYVLSLAVLLSSLATAGAAAQTSVQASVPESEAVAAPTDGGRSIAAVRVQEGAIALDGNLTEQAWQRAAVVRDLRRSSPVEDGRPGLGSAEFRLLYDRRALYIAARIEQPPGVARAHVRPRDDLGNDDSINIYIKPRSAGGNGYVFRINPLGIVRDIMIVGYNRTFGSWDAVWDVASQPLPNGYQVEVRIPFRILRMSRTAAPDMEIGFGVNSGSLGQLDLWPRFSSERGHHLDQLGALEGIDDIEIGNNLVLLPSLVFRYGGQEQPDGSFAFDDSPVFRLRRPGYIDPGLDLHYRVGGGITASLTVNPDFSQVEADPDQLDHNLRYPLLLEETRPFFLEAQSSFDTPISLLYSRSVNDPVAGARVMGTTGRTTIGLLSAWDLDPPPSRIRFDPSVTDVDTSGFEDLSDKEALSTAARVSFDLTSSARVGTFFAAKQALGSGGERVAENYLAAADARFTLGGNYTITGQTAIATSGPVGGDSLTGGLAFLHLLREGRRLTVEAETAYYGSGFRAETSNLSRVGYIPSLARVAYRVELERAGIAYLEPSLTGNLAYDDDSFDLLDWSVVPALGAQMAGNTSASLSLQLGEEFYNGRTFRARQATLAVSTSPVTWLDGSISLTGGDQINYDPADDFLGTSYAGSVSMTLRPSLLSQIEARYLKGLFYRPMGAGREADIDIMRLKAVYSFDSRWSLRLISQLNTSIHSLQTSALLSYLYRPGTAVYVGYQDTEPTATTSSIRTERHAFVKLSYLGWL